MQNNQASKSQIFVELAGMLDSDDRLTKIAGIIRGDTGDTGATSCRLLTMGECCERLGISRVTIWRLVKAGRLSFVDIGRGTRRIPESEIIRFANGKIKACSRAATERRITQSQEEV